MNVGFLFLFIYLFYFFMQVSQDGQQAQIDLSSMKDKKFS